MKKRKKQNRKAQKQFPNSTQGPQKEHKNEDRDGSAPFDFRLLLQAGTMKK